MSLNTAGLRLRDAVVITIASGIATVTQSYHKVAAESGTADDLDTLAVTSLADLSVAAIDYRPFIVLEADAGDTITVKHATGNISLNGAADYALSGDKKLLLFYDGTVWADIAIPSSGGGGGIGGSTGSTDNALLRADGTGGSTLQASPVIVDDSGNLSGAPRIDTTDIRAASSAGLTFETQGATDILLLGAGNAANATFYGNVSMGTTHKIVSMADPTSAQDAATKNYVDAYFPVDEADGGTGITTYATGDILYASASNTLAKLAAGTDGHVLTLSSGVPSWAASGGGSNPDYVRLSYTVANNTQGGSSTSGSWQTRPINTEDSDDSNICTLSANEFTLAAGTYDLFASGVFYNDSNFQRMRLYNTDDATTLILGETLRYGQSANVTTQNIIRGRFTLATSKTLRLEYRVGTGRATDGLGIASNYSVDEIYAVIELWRVS